MGRVGLLVYKNEKIINHWTFPGEWSGGVKPYIGDYNCDGKDEVYIFTRKSDSIFIHCVDPLNNQIVQTSSLVS